MTDLFDSVRESILRLDPVWFAEKYLTLDGKPFQLNGNGYKAFVDIYRYIGLKAIEKDARPVVLVKGRQVGATVMAAVLELYFLCSGLFGNNGRPPFRLIHCFPQLEMAAAYSKTKLNAMISSAKMEDSTKISYAKKAKNFIESKLANVAANSSMTYKQFENENHMFIESTGLDATRIRGRTCEAMFFDECQDIRAAALGNATKSLNKSQYGPPGEGVQVYFGTPKQSGTPYWNIWMNSTQQFYHLGCENCKQTFPFYTYGSDEWEKIWIEKFIIKCPLCDHEQDKKGAIERGKWVTTPGRENAKYVGFHINQLLMPEFSKEYIIGQKPENNPINSARTYKNEVLGEFFAGSSAPITIEEIDEKCAEPLRGFARSITAEDNCKVYLGCDWGAKVEVSGMGEGKKSGGQSYSCAVVLKTIGPNLLSIEFAKRLTKNSLEEKRGIVEQMFRQYNISLAVGDIGYANDLTELLQNDYGARFLASEVASRLNGHIKFKEDVFPSRIIFEKDYYIAELFSMLKDGKIKFPYKQYDAIEWLVEHCCSMEIKPVVDRSGTVGMRYVKGHTPNDGFMALLNAFLAYKFDVTNGFKITDPRKIIADPSLKQPIPAILGRVPALKRRK